MNKPRVFVTRTILEPGLKMVMDNCEAEIWAADLPPSHSEILNHVHGLRGAIVPPDRQNRR